MQQTNRVNTLMTTEKHFAQTLQRLPRFLAIHSPNLNESFFGTASLFLVHAVVTKDFRSKPVLVWCGGLRHKKKVTPSPVRNV